MYQPTRQFTPLSVSARLNNQPVENVAFFDTSGNPLIINSTTQSADTGATVKLTGYTPPSGSNVLATDTVNQAIAKLDARLRAASPAL